MDDRLPGKIDRKQVGAKHFVVDDKHLLMMDHKVGMPRLDAC